MMSKDLLQVALGYEGDAAPALPVEALASEMDSKLAPLAMGLLRLGVLHDTVQALEDQLKKDVRVLVKRRLQEQLAARGAEELAASSPAVAVVAEVDEVGQQQQAAAAAVDTGEGKASRTVMTQVRELSVEGFEEVIGGVVAPLLTLLRRSAVVHGALQKTLSAAVGNQGAYDRGASDDEEPHTSVAYIERVEKQATGMVQRVCELAHDRYARLLKTRKEVHARLPLMEFVRMSKSVTEFVRDVQHLSGQPYDALSGELQSHAHAFLQSTHESSMQKLEAIVEIEQWKQVVPATGLHSFDPVCWAPACASDSPSHTATHEEIFAAGGRRTRVPGHSQRIRTEPSATDPRK